MTNDATRASDTAMPKITRRSLISSAPAIGIAAVTPAVAAPTIDGTKAPENSTLLDAYEAWRSAMDDLATAKNDLVWLIDEWWHLWPLAPDEILGCARFKTRSGC